MEDVILKTTLDDSRFLYISPIDRATYDEHISDDNLGGEDGYFLVVSHKNEFPRTEVLAKAPTLEAAKSLFSLIVVGQQDTDEARRANYGLAPLFL